MEEYVVPVNQTHYRFLVNEHGIIQQVQLPVKDASKVAVFSHCYDDSKHELLLTDGIKTSALQLFIRYANSSKIDQLLSSLKGEDKELAIKCLREFHSEILQLMVKYV